MDLTTRISYNPRGEIRGGRLNQLSPPWNLDHLDVLDVLDAVGSSLAALLVGNRDDQEDQGHQHFQEGHPPRIKVC